MDWFIGSLSFIGGSIIGSFLNVIVYRLPRKMSVLYPASHCIHCESTLRWYEKLPLISYLLQAGKCSHCHTHISFRYPLLELIVSVLFMVCAGYAQNIYHFIFLTFIFSVFLCIIFIDIEHFIIPDKLLIAGAIGSIIYYTYIAEAAIYLYLMDALIVFTVFMLLRSGSSFVFKKEGFGMGDVKLATLIGFLIGWKSAILSIFFGFVLAGLVITILMAGGWFKRKSYIPFGPFIISGMLTHLLFGKTIISWYLHTFLSY